MPVSLTVPLLKKPNTVKDAVVSILVSEWPLTARKVYNRVRKEGLNVSYQAVHKVLKGLLAQNVLERENTGYKLSLSWIREIKGFSNKIEDYYTDESKPPLEKMFRGEVTSATFNNLFGFFDFLMDFFPGFAGNKNDLFGIMQHLYWSLSFEGRNYIRFKNLVNSFKAGYFLLRYETNADKVIAEHYNSFSPVSSFVYGVDCAKDCDTFVSGDYIAQVFYTEEFKKKMDYAYNILTDIKSDAISKLMETVFFEETKITILLNKNSVLAEQIRRETLKYFSGNYKDPTEEKLPKNLVFNSMHEVDKFLLEHVPKLNTSNNKKPLYIHWSHLWMPLFISRTSYKNIKTLQKKFDSYVISKNCTTIDKWCREFWLKNSNFNVKCGIDLKTEDFIVLDDYLIQIFYPEQLKKELHTTFSKAKDITEIDSDRIFSNIFEREATIPVIIDKNRKSAEKFRNAVLDHFKE